MERRTGESPMDFEWQNPPPGDPTSPFHILSVNARQNGVHGTKRPYNAFESPSKPAPPPNAAFQNFSFSTPSNTKTLPNAFQRSSAFTTPRKFDMDFSSGAENPSSPDNGDLENTPEGPTKGGTIRGSTAITRFTGAPAEDRPIYGLTKTFGRTAFSPGRGQLRRGKYADTVGRVRKRTRGTHQRDGYSSTRRDSWGSEDSSEDEDVLQPRRHERSSHTLGAMSKDQPSGGESGIRSFITFLVEHPSIPAVLANYLIFFIWTFLAILICSVIFGAFRSFNSDVTHRQEHITAKKLVEIAACADEYMKNRCDRASRVPAMEGICNTWEVCMKQDATKTARMEVTAKSFAEILNNMFETVSIRAWVGIGMCLLMVFSLPKLVGSLSPKPTPIYIPIPQKNQHYQPAIPNQRAGFASNSSVLEDRDGETPKTLTQPQHQITYR